MARLDGKIALVTGGNSGIGLATAKQFVNEGAYVFITGRREPELAAAVKEIRINVTGVRGDVSNIDDLDRLFAQIKRERGKLDLRRYESRRAFLRAYMDDRLKGTPLRVNAVSPGSIDTPGARLDTIELLKPRAVITGHKRPGKDDSPKIIEETRQYIRDFDRLAGTTTTARELYGKMLERYPERVNPLTLWLSAHAAKP